MQGRPEGPLFHPLPRTSAALNEVLRNCFLRASFQSDHRFSGVRPLSTASALGSVSHRLLEEASRGRFDSICGTNLDKEVARRWAFLVALEEQEFQRRAHGSVPTHNRWPTYALRMATACRLASRIARQRGSRLPWKATAVVGSNSPTQAEVWYEGYGGKIVGRVDLLRRTGAGIELVDYKSGLVTEQQETLGAAGRLREPYERQMLLYAALVHENEGRWPVKVTVESLVQGSHTIEVTPDRAQDAADEALVLLNAYNRRVTSGTVRGQPSASTCRWCDFKAVCQDFLEVSTDEWGGPSVTVIGRLRSVSFEPPSYLELDVTGGDHPKGSITIRAVPVSVAVKVKRLEGAIFSFSGLRRTPGSDDLRFDWTSQGWRWLGVDRD